jgi:hypothetical protein
MIQATSVRDAGPGSEDLPHDNSGRTLAPGDDGKDLMQDSGRNENRKDQQKKGSGEQVQYKDEDRYCDRHYNDHNRADVNRTFILTLIIVDQTGG